MALLQKPPQFIRKLDRSAEVDQGEPLELKCIVEGSPLPVATWFKDGQEIEPNDRYDKISNEILFQSSISMHEKALIILLLDIFVASN